ncbi:Holo-[acyl-carrier-protein] synthase [bioreactor metagenome]|uniref:Holo-[acyl-carrier-protein] synthase n=1 Tax=bioreactor metagenome TaxID=1076179 RepID=A0A645EH14_9ZZZZ
MSQLSCGVDLIEIDRFKNLTPAIRSRFIKRVYTAAEAEICRDRDESLAGRFAAKEAVAKALGCGIGVVHWQDIETLVNEDGQPQLKLHGAASRLAEELGYNCWSVSITHTAKLAMAFVVVLSGGNEAKKEDL